MVKNERFVSISALSKSVLKKWRWMLLTAILIALLAGGYRAFKLYPKTLAAQSTTQEAEVSSADQAIPLNAELEKIERSIAEKNLYFENSFFSKINANEPSRATATLIVTTDTMKEQDSLPLTYDSPGNIVQLADTTTRTANRILTYYTRIAEYFSDWGDLLEKYSTKPQYLTELINIRNYNKDLACADIVVYFTNEDGALELLNCILNALNNSYSEAAASFGEHTLQVTAKCTATNGADKTYYNWMNDRVGEINNLCTQRDNLKNNMRLVKTSSSSETTVLSKGSLIRSSILYAVIGFIGGLVLFTILYAIVLILSNVVLSARELNRQYGLNKLAVVPSASQVKKGIDSLVAQIDKDYFSSNDSVTAYKIALENIRNTSGSGSKIALFGDLSVGIVDQSRLALSQSAEGCSDITFCSLGELNTNPAKLTELETCDSAVLLVKTGTSKYNSLNDLIRTVEAYGKHILGSLVID